jgi:hypothetical protein
MCRRDQRTLSFLFLSSPPGAPPAPLDCWLPCALSVSPPGAFGGRQAHHDTGSARACDSAGAWWYGWKISCGKERQRGSPVGSDGVGLCVCNGCWRRCALLRELESAVQAQYHVPSAPPPALPQQHRRYLLHLTPDTSETVAHLLNPPDVDQTQLFSPKCSHSLLFLNYRCTARARPPPAVNQSARLVSLTWRQPNYLDHSLPFARGTSATWSANTVGSQPACCLTHSQPLRS